MWKLKFLLIEFLIFYVFKNDSYLGKNGLGKIQTTFANSSFYAYRFLFRQINIQPYSYIQLVAKVKFGPELATKRDKEIQIHLEFSITPFSIANMQ